MRRVGNDPFHLFDVEQRSLVCYLLLRLIHYIGALEAIER